MFASSKLFAVSALLALFIGLTWAVPVTLPGGVNPGGPNIPVIPSVLPSGNPGLPTIPSLPTGVPQVGEGKPVCNYAEKYTLSWFNFR